LAKVKRDAYQKDDQPVRIDRSGQDYGDNVDALMKKYSSKKLKKESVTDNQVINEMQEIKNLMSYNKKTQ
jgi:hypothetical protein